MALEATDDDNDDQDESRYQIAEIVVTELIQNGSFEFNANERDGWGPSTAWKILRPGHSLGMLQSRMDNSIHPNNPTYMRLHAERTREFYDYNGWRGYGIQNDGFGGMVVKAGQKYDFSVFLRTQFLVAAANVF